MRMCVCGSPVCLEIGHVFAQVSKPVEQQHVLQDLCDSWVCCVVAFFPTGCKAIGCPLPETAHKHKPHTSTMQSTMSEWTSGLLCIYPSTDINTLIKMSSHQIDSFLQGEQSCECYSDHDKQALDNTPNISRKTKRSPHIFL